MRMSVDVDRLRCGMFIDSMEGSWLTNPFWRQRFLIASADEIAALRDSGIRRVVVDLDRGLRPVEVPSLPTTPEPPEPATDPQAYDFDPADRAPTAIQEERRRAQAIVARPIGVLRGVFDGARFGAIVRSDEVGEIVDQIASSINRNHHALIGIVRLKSKDEYTYLHSVAVAALMISLARQLGLPDDVRHRLGMAGLLHDIGKMGVPAPILNKPGKLTDDEFRIVRSHPERGTAILLEAQGVPDEALDVCRHHHEKIDGTGYPYGLKGEQISLAARMGAICDVCDALTSNRIYKSAWTPAEAVLRMWGWEGQFDRALLFAFFQAIGIFPVGLPVRLASGRGAIVLPNGRRASRPRVRIFLSADGEIEPCRDMIVGEADSSDSIEATLDPVALGARNWPGAAEYLLRETGTIAYEPLRELWHGPRPTLTTGQHSTGNRQVVSGWAPLTAIR